jgi:rhodanese-related sulfurtransferase
MGNVQSTKKVNYEDIQLISKRGLTNTLLINTLNLQEQDCLIPNTVSAPQEEKVINENIKNIEINIVIYGRNSNDKGVQKKYLKLSELGFTNIYIYPGGLFEWLCLQDIYGSNNFPSTKSEMDILKYKPRSQFLSKSLISID